MTDIGELVLRIKADAAQLEREMGKANAVVKQSSGSMGLSLNTLRGQFLALASAVGAAQIVRAITTYEKLQASLRTVTGSAAAAGQAFSMIQQFAQTTPFSLEEATAGFIKLKALGLDPSEESLRSYGNTASAMGKSLNQMIEAVADAATGEFERLKEFGIRASQQGDSVVFTFQGVSTKVGKSAAEIEEYLRKIGDVNFAGAMKEQENTVSTALSNMGDSFDKLANQIGESGLNDAIIAIANTIKSLNERLADSIRLMTEVRNAPTLDNTASAVPGDTGFGTGGPGSFVFGQNPNANRSTEPHTNFPLEEYVRPRAPTAGDSKAVEKRAKQITDARAALDDYNRALKEEEVLLGMTGREREAQEDRFRLEEIARKGGITLTREQIEANAELAASNYDLKEAQDELTASMREAEQIRALFHDRMTSGLTDIIFRTNSAKDAFKGLAEQLARMAFERKVISPFVDSLLGTGGGGGLFDNLFSGGGAQALDNAGAYLGLNESYGPPMQGFAEGGRPPVGVPSIVGENGPEIFVPDGAGTVIPNHQIGGSSVNVYQTIQIMPGVPELIDAKIRQAAPSIASAAHAAVFADIERGGKAARAVGRR